MGNYRIVIADDHPLIRQGLKKVIEGVPGLEVVGEAGDGLSLLGLFETAKPDMVILDISMPHLRGIEAISLVKNYKPGIKILIFSMHKEYFRQALAAGAAGHAHDRVTPFDQGVHKMRSDESGRAGEEDVDGGTPWLLLRRTQRGFQANTLWRRHVFVNFNSVECLVKSSAKGDEAGPGSGCSSPRCTGAQAAPLRRTRMTSSSSTTGAPPALTSEVGPFSTRLATPRPGWTTP